MVQKSAAAFRTIGEVSAEFGIPQHILRYWETRFPQLRPMQRAGQRRYYRPEDVALVRRIDQLLRHQGLTVKGVQQALAMPEPAPPSARKLAIRVIRDRLAAALAADEPAT